MKIDWKQQDAKQNLYKALDKMIEGDIEEIHINNIVSSEFCSLMDVSDEKDFNGWVCDWWGDFTYKEVKFNVFGGAWYGTIEISLPDDTDE